VAGKRAGLEGERSGLFIEQIRIVKEMREHDRASGRSAFLVRPRYMVWENVPGSLSSNQGKDFQAVLTEIVRIADPNAPDVPMPEKKWAWSGCLYDDMGRWSVAWRIHDAQFWGTTMWDDTGNPLWLGTPQRRKRIAVVADFGGLSAPEILFERKGLRRDPEPSEPEREETAGAVGTGTKESSKDSVADNPKLQGADMYNGTLTGDVSATLNATSCDSSTHSGPSVICLEGNGTRESHHGDGYSVTETMYTLNGTEQHAVAAQTTSGRGYQNLSEASSSDEYGDGARV
jgi:DNA (cytosine-5)-methyltransferase 1